MRAVLYLRLSSITEESTSIARQEQDLVELAERENWEIARILVDDGVSGRKARANAAEALRMIRDREADVLAVWKLDRWTRQGLSAVGDLVAALDSAPGSLFVALRDGLRSDQASWRLVAAVMSEVARTEAENTATRVKSSIAYRKTVLHSYSGGTVPYGYRPAVDEDDPKRRVLVIDITEASLLRDIADRLLERDESQTSIVRWLNENGIPTGRSGYRLAVIRGEDPTGLDRGMWRIRALQIVMTSPSLAGQLTYRGETVRDGDGMPIMAWEPIVPAAMLYRLRQHLAPKPREVRRRRGARLLSGLLFCAHCGGPMYVTSTTPVYYRCSQPKTTGQCSGSPRAVADWIEKVVVDDFLSIAGNAPETTVTVDEVTSAGNIAELDQALADLAQSMLAPGADYPTLIARIEELKQRRAALEAMPDSATETVVYTGRSIREAWESTDDLDLHRSLLRELILHVELTAKTTKGGAPDPSRVSVVWMPEHAMDVI